MTQKSSFICTTCGKKLPKWSGQCPVCKAWHTVTEEDKGKGKLPEPVPLTAVHGTAKRLSTNIAILDDLLGGGMIAGGTILVGGEPGIGKSTLLLQLVTLFPNALYVSAEESSAQVGERAKRLCEKPQGKVVHTTDLEAVLSLAERHRPSLLVVDSIQTVRSAAQDSPAGSLQQIRHCAQELVELAKEKNIVLWLVGHVTKDGQLAGPKALEHIVDTVLYVEGEGSEQLRLIRVYKNRFGATHELALFRMTQRGMHPVPSMEKYFLDLEEDLSQGSAVFCALEGSRTFFVEIQALIHPSPFSNPGRTTVGWDRNRLSMILAIVENHTGLSWGNADVYISVSGGFKIRDPQADLAVTAALLSCQLQTPIPAGTICLGEVSLSGTIKKATHLRRRLHQADKLGFSKVWGHVVQTEGLPIATKPVHTVKDLWQYLRGAP